VNGITKAEKGMSLHTVTSLNIKERDWEELQEMKLTTRTAFNIFKRLHKCSRQEIVG